MFHVAALGCDVRLIWARISLSFCQEAGRYPAFTGSG